MCSIGARYSCWEGLLRPIFVFIALLGATLVLAACGGAATEVSSTNGRATAPAGTPEASTQQQKEGAVVKDGDEVSVHYRGTLDGGEEFDSSQGGEPLTFTVGGGQVIPGFDDAVRGLAVGEKRKVRLEAKEAYGERRDDLVIAVPKANAPEGLKVGDRVLLGNTPATVEEITNEMVRVDANHPLAGQALTFEIEVMGIK